MYSHNNAQVANVPFVPNGLDNQGFMTAPIPNFNTPQQQQHGAFSHQTQNWDAMHYQKNVSPQHVNGMMPSVNVSNTPIQQNQFIPQWTVDRYGNYYWYDQNGQWHLYNQSGFGAVPVPGCDQSPSTSTSTSSGSSNWTSNQSVSPVIQETNGTDNQQVAPMVFSQQIPYMIAPMQDMRIQLTVEMDAYNKLSRFGEVEQLTMYAGRKLFTALHFRIIGIQAEGIYIVGLQMIKCSGELQYNKETLQWSEMADGNKDRDIAPYSNEVRTAKKSGAEMMKKGLGLADVKTYSIGTRVKNPVVKPEMCLVSTLHRYIPHVRIWQLGGDGSELIVHEQLFREASFFAVSGVCNQQIRDTRAEKQPNSKFKNGKGKQSAVVKDQYMKL